MGDRFVFSHGFAPLLTLTTPFATDLKGAFCCSDAAVGDGEATVVEGREGDFETADPLYRLDSS